LPLIIGFNKATPTFHIRTFLGDLINEFGELFGPQEQDDTFTIIIQSILMEIFLFFDILKGDAIEERVARVALNGKASLADDSMLEESRDVSWIKLTDFRVEPTLKVGHV
jgi:hypothetical protein